MATIVSYPGNYRVLKSSLVCALTKQTFTEDSKDFKMGETNKTEAFISANPFHAVPTLFVEGSGVFESNAVAGYFARTGKEVRNLLGEGVLQESRVESFSAAVSSLENRVATWAYNKLGFPWMALGVNCTQAGIDGSLAGATEMLRNFQSALTNNNGFLVGDNYTVADLSLFAATNFLFKSMFDDAKYVETLPELVAWWKKTGALEEFAGLGLTSKGAWEKSE
jgi:glutathione S-transferase